MNTKKIAGLCFASIVLVLFFQNCGQAGFENEDNSASTSSVDPKFKNLPFPYEISVNQVAYMSCPLSATGVNDQFFTFRAGAYENLEAPIDALGLRISGVKLSDAYFTAFTQAANSFPAAVRKDKLATALSTVPNAYAQPFLSVRAKTETKHSPFFGPGSTEIQQRSMLAPLNEMAYTQTFRDAYAELPGKTVGFFNLAKFTTGSKLKSVSGAITLPAQEAQLQSLKSLLINQYLTVGLVDPDAQVPGFSSPLPHGPDASGSLMYGQGLSFYFERPRVFYNASATNALQINQEVDLATGSQTSATWDCSRRFKIVPQDVKDSLMYAPNGTATPICPSELYTDLNSSVAKRQTYQLLRRFLNTEAWEINVTRGCVVPKINGCYANSQNVVYDEAYFATPNPAASPRQSAGCGGAGQYQCPHYLTLCVRR